MDQRTIRYFVEVANARSIRAASEKLFVAGSAISRKISMLEEQLGVQLFERTAHGMMLTTAGELYRQYALEALQGLEHFQAEIDRMKGLTRGHVRVVSLDGVVSEFAIRAWAEFHVRYPDVTLELRTSAADMVTKALHDRNADIGIGANAKREYGIEPVLSLSTPLLAVMTPELATSHAKTLRFKDIISKHPVAVPDEHFVIRRQINACAKAQRIDLLPALVTNSVDALRAFARHCKGVTFLPSLAVREDLKNKVLVGIPLEDKILRAATIDILVTAGRQLPVAVIEFLRCLQQVGKNLAKAGPVQ